jgi:hypothetical protein
MENAAEQSGPTDTRSPIATSVVRNALAALAVTDAKEIQRT